MKFPRLPRFERVAVPPIQLTERDIEIIRLVHRHRFLRSSHLLALVSGSRQQLIRRLQMLYHHGYLERPRAQLEYYYKGGSREMAYGLGNKGVALLREKLGIFIPMVDWNEKDSSIGKVFLEHALFVSDVLVSLELACRNTSVKILTQEELCQDGNDERFRWKVTIGNGQRQGVIPDRIFALEYADAESNAQRILFFLEADRGTMPVMRDNLFLSSFYRKLLAYEATWSQDIHRTQFGFNRFRVMTVTTSAKRVNTLIDACSKLKSGHGLFLFVDWKSVEKNGVFSLVWRNGRGETVSLLN